MPAAQKPYTAQDNMLGRAILCASGLYMTRRLQPQTGALGSQIKIPLERTGVVTGVILQVSMSVVISATATPSPCGPYNLFNNLTYVDFAGLQRVNTSGFLLHALNNFKTQRIEGNAVNYVATNIGSSEKALNTNILAVPTGVGTANLVFHLYVPLAYDPRQDLRGAVLAQAIYGEHYITVTLPTALVGTDPLAFPYTAGTITNNTTATCTITPFMEYIMPQAGAGDLPLIDLSTIYAIEGNMQDSSNFTVNANKYLNWPNNRSILSAMHFLNQAGTGGVLNETDVNSVLLLGNSNTNIKEMNPALLRMQNRFMLQTDMASGLYYLPSRAQPITTQLYGNVQTVFNMATAGAGTYVSSQYESTYLSGTPLPGVIQG